MGTNQPPITDPPNGRNGTKASWRAVFTDLATAVTLLALVGSGYALRQDYYDFKAATEKRAVIDDADKKEQQRAWNRLNFDLGRVLQALKLNPQITQNDP